tara:strand:+ start:671 stop:2047 length:1377 start_codon:yes stop_codon:yes gene_type:complete
MGDRVAPEKSSLTLPLGSPPNIHKGRVTAVVGGAMNKEFKKQAENEKVNKKVIAEFKSGKWKDWHFVTGEFDTYFLKRDVLWLIKSTQKDGKTILSDNDNRLHLRKIIHSHYIKKQEAEKLSRYENNSSSIWQFFLEQTVEFITFDREGNPILSNQKENLPSKLEDLEIKLEKIGDLIDKYGKKYLDCDLKLEEKILKDKVLLLKHLKKVIPGSAYWLLMENYLPTKVQESGLHKNIDKCFYKDGDMWVVSFKGKRTALKDSIGMTYIKMALAQEGKNEGTPILELQLHINKEPAEVISQGEHETVTFDADNRESKYKDELNVKNVSGNDREFYEGDTGDSSSYIFLLKKIKDLEEEYENSKESDPTHAHHCSNEKKKIENLTYSMYDKNGTIREATKGINRTRISITNAIKRAKDNIKSKGKEVPGLYKHIDNFVKIKNNHLVYSPESPIKWKTEKK